MITIQNGKLTIPDDDRFIGFAGDDLAVTKQFILLDFAEDHCKFTLCLRYDDDTVKSVPLSAAADHGNTELTWCVAREQLYVSGIVQAQIKIVDSGGNVRHSSKDFFLIGSAVELDDGGSEMECVTPSQLENSINQALQAVTATAPFIDSSGYWCIFDTEQDLYVRTQYHVSGIAPDSVMSDSSDNAVSNRVIKQYVDAKAVDCNTFSAEFADMKASDKVPNTRRIAQLALSSDISAENLMTALRPYLYRTSITPNSGGVTGQLGIGTAGEVFFCTATDRWNHLASYSDLYEKMDLAAEIDTQDVDLMEDGSLFFIDGVLYVKYDDDPVALAQVNDVYTKTEIDTMLGDVESLLSAI
ncbi:MAG: hypothetical protein IJH07_01360 [Ruminococcus sp.]|nr:hypothetical protein [Ruminococcus sp.]